MTRTWPDSAVSSDPDAMQARLQLTTNLLTSSLHLAAHIVGGEREYIRDIYIGVYAKPGDEKDVLTALRPLAFIMQLAV
jgi:hypothetical protein